MSQTVTVQPGFASAPLPVGPFSIVSVSPTSSAAVVYTEDSLASINNGLATWSAWPSGTVTAYTQNMSNSQMFVRMSANTAAATITISDPNPLQQEVDPSPWVGGGQSFSGPILVGDGTAAAPSIAFTSDTDTGFRRLATGTVNYVADGVDGILLSGGRITVGASARLSWAGTAGANGTEDAQIIRDAADTLAMKRGATSQTFRVYGAFAATTTFAALSHNGTNAIVSTQGGGLQLSASSMGFYGQNVTSRPAGISVISASSGALASTLAMVLNSLGLINCTSVAG